MTRIGSGDRLVIFDVDGTLCDTNEIDEECFLTAASEALGVERRRLDWQYCPDTTDAGILRWLWQGQLDRLPTQSEVAAVRDRFVALLEEQLAHEPWRFAAIPGAAELLAGTGSARWDAVIATGGWSRSARLKLAAAGLPGENLLASSDDSVDRLEIFRLAHQRAVERRGRDYARTVLVGDGAWDVRVAASLGWSFTGVANGERAESLRRAGASSVVTDFQDAARFLEVLEGCGVPRR
jgi:phosphoglycolate phosphatase-like HAD superfamily hydrolase